MNRLLPPSETSDSLSVLELTKFVKTNGYLLYSMCLFSFFLFVLALVDTTRSIFNLFLHFVANLETSPPAATYLLKRRAISVARSLNPW